MGWRTSPLTRIASLYGCLSVRFPRRGFLTGKGRYLISIATVAVALALGDLPTAHAQTELAFPPMLTQPAILPLPPRLRQPKRCAPASRARLA